MRPSEVKRLYELMGHQVYVRSMYLLREEQAAMDITQDVFATLLGKVLTFPDDRRAAAWLLRVATNRSLNELRRRKYWRTAQVPPEELAAADPFTRLQEDRVLLDSLLVTLSDRDANIVTSYFLEGRTLEEAAQAARCSVPTVRRTIQRFLDKARARVNDRD